MASLYNRLFAILRRLLPHTGIRGGSVLQSVTEPPRRGRCTRGTESCKGHPGGESRFPAKIIKRADLFGQSSSRSFLGDNVPLNLGTRRCWWGAPASSLGREHRGVLP